MKVNPMIERIFLAVGYRIMIAVRSQDERVSLTYFIASLFLAHIQAALCYDE
ncbi:hypothetical protein D3C77_714530 [compost metagenome]